MSDITIRSKALNMEITAFVCFGSIEELYFPKTGNSLPDSMFVRVIADYRDTQSILDAANEAAFDDYYSGNY